MKTPLVLLSCALIAAGCSPVAAKSSLPSPSPSPSPSSTVAVAPTGKAFAVAAPGELLRFISGPAPRNQGPCTPATVTATGRTTRANDGVLGIITLVGHSCSLAVNPDKIRLLDAAGSPLPVTTTQATGINPAFPVRPDLSEGEGSASVGFSWTGSYCGSGSVAVQIPALPAIIRVPLAGPRPSCSPGKAGRLTPGVIAGLSAAVEPAPEAWTSLRARLVIPQTVNESPIPMSVVLTTVGTTAVSLAAPCPTYIVTLSHADVPGRGFGGGGSDLQADFGDLCSKPFVVRPGHPLTLTIPALQYTPEAPWKVGSPLLAQWAIAGVPTASASAVIR